MLPAITRVRVRYSETDQMGVVYHANYLVWMEVARVDYCRQAGFRYKDLEIEHGILLAVTEANCRYLSPARYDDEIEIETTLTRATIAPSPFNTRCERCRRTAKGRSRGGLRPDRQTTCS